MNTRVSKSVWMIHFGTKDIAWNQTSGLLYLRLFINCNKIFSFLWNPVTHNPRLSEKKNPSRPPARWIGSPTEQIKISQVFNESRQAPGPRSHNARWRLDRITDDRASGKWGWTWILSGCSGENGNQMAAKYSMFWDHLDLKIWKTLDKIKIWKNTQKTAKNKIRGGPHSALFSSQKFSRFSVTSNLWSHAWSIKYR